MQLDYTYNYYLHYLNCFNLISIHSFNDYTQPYTNINVINSTSYTSTFYLQYKSHHKRPCVCCCAPSKSGWRMGGAEPGLGATVVVELMHSSNG